MTVQDLQHKMMKDHTVKKHEEAYIKIWNEIASGNIIPNDIMSVENIKRKIDFPNKGPVRDTIFKFLSAHIFQIAPTDNTREYIKLVIPDQTGLSYISKFRKIVELDCIKSFIENASPENKKDFYNLNDEYKNNFSVMPTTSEDRIMNALIEKKYHTFFANALDEPEARNLIISFFDRSVLVSGDHYKNALTHKHEHENLSTAISNALENTSYMNDVEVALNTHIDQCHIRIECVKNSQKPAPRSSSTFFELHFQT